MLPSTRRPLVAIAAAALAFALTSCGDDSAEAESEALTAAEFKTQADDLCAASDEELDKLDDDLTEESTKEEIEAFLQTGVDRTRELADDIEALEEPSELSADVDAMLESVREAADVIEEKGVELMSAEEDPFEDASEKAKALGLEECGD